MALRQPIALENASGTERPNADEFRLLIQHLFAFDDTGGAGVVPFDALTVTEKSGTPNMSVDIAAGGAFVQGTESSPGGLYFVYNDATVNVAVSAADPTNPRKDLVIVRCRDSFHSGASDDAQFVVVAGTPAASPAEPDLDALGYENYLVLALIDVPASDTAITNSQITDRRTSGGLRTTRLIERQVLTAATASVSFTVPAAFNDLRLIAHARGDTAAASTNGLLRFNGDSGNNYAYQRHQAIAAADSAAGSVTQSHIRLPIIAAASAAAGRAGMWVVDIPNYRGTSFHKFARVAGDAMIGATTADLSLENVDGVWLSTSAITSITLTLAAGNFAAGSTFALYGS